MNLLTNIKYDSYFKQLSDGSFDIYFDPNIIQDVWKPNLIDIVNCVLFSNKRVSLDEIQNVPLQYKGGSVCDIVGNETGSYFGSLVFYESLRGGDRQIRRQNILNSLYDALNELKKNYFIDSFTIVEDDTHFNKTELYFNISIVSNGELFKESFFIKYDN